MRILFLSQYFAPEPAVVSLQLVNYFRNAGHDVEVITGFPNWPGGTIYEGYRNKLWQREVIEDVPILRVPLYPSHDRSTLRRVATYASFAASAAILGPALTRRPDVIYVHQGPATVTLPALTLGTVRGVPIIYHIQDLWPDSVVESGMVGSGFLKQLTKATLNVWQALSYRAAAAIIVQSPGMEAVLRARMGGLPPIEVLYNWADESRFHPARCDDVLARRLGMHGLFNIVYAGNLGKFQSLHTLIEAAASLGHLPDLRLVIIGKGPIENDLRQHAASLGANNVRFLGQLPYDCMAMVNALSDVLVVSLEDIELFRYTIPSKTQASLASARPLLMAVSGDAAELVRSARAGVVCAPADPKGIAESMEHLYRMPRSEREQLGANGREYYENHLSFAAGVRRLEAIALRVSG